MSTVENGRFTVVPAIDLIDGRCVRLTQGDYGRSTEYRQDPSEVACEFARAGATRIHVVDLDAARGGGNNRDALSGIRASFDGILEVGGGVRTYDDVQRLLDVGVDRLVVGTVLAREPDSVARWCRAHPGVIVAGIDAREGIVKVSGWTEDDGLSAEALATTAGGLGCVSIIYTDISVDGTGDGPDLAGAREVRRASGLPVIASGGVGTVGHVEACAAARPDGIVGVIAGRALYEGTIDLAEVLARFPSADASSMKW